MYLGQIINKCGDENVHPGKGNCTVPPGKVKYLLLTAPNAVYPMDPDEFIAGLPGYVTDPGMLRMVPIGSVSGNDPSGGDIITTAPGNYGGTETVGINQKSVSYQIEGADKCQYKELSKLNRKTKRVFEFTDSGYVEGTVRMVGNPPVPGFAGYLGKIYVWETKATGTEPYKVYLTVDYSADYESENQNSHSFEVGVGNFPSGLQGVSVEVVEGGTVRIVTSCGGEDITAMYGDDWDIAAFVNETGGNPTTATFNAQTGLITLAPTGKYRVANADVLNGLNIIGYEGSNIYVQVTVAPGP